LGYLRANWREVSTPACLEIGAAGAVRIEGTDNFSGGVTRYNTSTYANTPVQIEGGSMTFVDPGSGTRNNTIGKFSFVNGGTLDIQTRNRVDLNSLGGIVSSGRGAATIGWGNTQPSRNALRAIPRRLMWRRALRSLFPLSSTARARPDATGGLGITKTGIGTLTLTGNNSDTTTRINSGTLQVGNGGTKRAHWAVER
jgi:autotransporter-associated beta strand protein